MSGMTRRSAMAGILGGVGVLGGCDGAFQVGGGGSGHASFLGQTPPSLEAGGTWLNSDAPLTIAGLAGSVVWLEFSFLH
jgi:hypothetical protein